MNNSITNLLTADTLVKFVHGASKALSANREQIDALNVFPVPDGDTGTNICLTLDAICKAVSAAIAEPQQPDAAALSHKMANAALMGARGNSGLILSQFFRGLSKGFEEQSPTCISFVAGMKYGSQMAEQAVHDPKEGTMLTVMRESAAGAERGLATLAGTPSDFNFETMLANACESAREAVIHTPEQLSVLRDAGVVDAGGFGFAIALAGALALLNDEDPAQVRLHIEGSSPNAVSIDRQFLAEVGEEAWGYCVVFGLVGSEMNFGGVKSEMESLGRSAVVAGDSSAMRVHVHTEDPGKALTAALARGELRNIEIGNMNEQTSVWANKKVTPSLDVGQNFKTTVVAVVTGEGMKEAFASAGLGAVVMVNGGDTQNPSVGELAKSVESSPTDEVIILPNSTNVIGTAKLVPELSKKFVHIVETTSMQEGIAALLAFSPEEPAEDNIQSMKSSTEQIISGAVSKATRNAVIDGVDIKKGQFLANVGKKITTVANSPRKATFDAISQIAQDGALVTIYYGGGVKEHEADALAGEMRHAITGVEFEVMYGGQPHHQFLFSVE